jgi:hypothetical protein
MYEVISGRVLCGILLLKGGQTVDSLERMNQALTYIEENLADEIDFKQVEQLALCMVPFI